MKFQKSVVPVRVLEPGLEQGTKCPKSWRGNFNFEFFQKLISYSGHQGVQLGTVDGIVVQFGHTFLKFRKSVVPVRAVEPGLEQGTRCPKSWRGNFNFEFFQKLIFYSGHQGVQLGRVDGIVVHFGPTFLKFRKSVVPVRAVEQGLEQGKRCPKFWRGNFNFEFFQKLISYSEHQGVQLGTVDGIVVQFGHIF